MDVLQSTVALLAAFDPELLTNRKRQTKRKATRLIAKVPTVVAGLG